MKRKNSNSKIQVNDISNYVLRTIVISLFVCLFFVFSLLVVCGIDFFLFSSDDSNRTPLMGTYIIVTESMVPTINVNDAIVVKRVKDNNLKVGDIITFSSNDFIYNGLTITHRIIDKRLDINGNYIYTTKGDNNDIRDSSFVSIDDIYGKVVIKIPKVGYIHKFVSTPYGFVISIIIPVVIVITYEVYRILSLVKKRYKEIEIL